MRSLTIFMLVFVVGAAQASTRRIAAGIDYLARPYVERGDVVGMTIGVLYKGEPIVRGYGQLSAEDDRIPDGQTIYEIGSLTKVFTGLLLADAVVQGRVELDTPVQTLLPRGVTLRQRDDQAVTLLNLATHTSGLPKIPSNLLRTADINNPYAKYSGKQLAEFLNSYRPRKRPGERIAYSNLGSGLLGDLVAREQKLTYESHLKRRVTEPMELRDTTIELDADAKRRLAPPHLANGKPAHAWDFNKLAGCGAIRSNVDDVLKFVGMHLDPPSGKLGKAIEMAWDEHQPAISTDDFALGLGWHLAQDGSTRWHTGQTGGYHSVVFANRQLDMAVVVLTNTATDKVDALAQIVIQFLAVAEKKPEAEKPVEEVEVDPAVMRRHVGKFRFPTGGVLSFSIQNERLFVQLTGQQHLELVAESEKRWRCKLVDATLVFKGTSVTLLQNGNEQVARRIE